MASVRLRYRLRNAQPDKRSRVSTSTLVASPWEPLQQSMSGSMHGCDLPIAIRSFQKQRGSGLQANVQCPPQAPGTPPGAVQLFLSRGQAEKATSLSHLGFGQSQLQTNCYTLVLGVVCIHVTATGINPLTYIRIHRTLDSFSSVVQYLQATGSMLEPGRYGEGTW
jgi:hypothetical protein